MKFQLAQIVTAAVAAIGLTLVSVDTRAAEKDIVDTAVSTGKFNTLAKALGAADLVDTLKGSGPFTVFAPTDEAFAKLPAGTVENLSLLVLTERDVEALLDPDELREAVGGAMADLSAGRASMPPRVAALVESKHSVLPFGPAVALLALSGVLAALVSEWFVDAIDPAVEALGISKAFTGLVIVAIAGNAVENVVAVQLASKGQNDLAISVVKNSVAQIACFLWPVLVLASLFFSQRLTFVIDPVFLGALALTAIALWQITGDGRAALYEGLALVSLYVVLATLVWFE